MGILRLGSLDAMKDLARHSESFRHIYTWPRESGNGKPIVNLHVKCMVADRDLLLLGSANLTQAAMERNMELGILLHGGPHPGHIRDHFQWLIRDAVLVPRVVGSAKLRDA